jgi:hypothetical protein
MNQEISWTEPEDELSELSSDVSFTQYDIQHLQMISMSKHCSIL